MLCKEVSHKSQEMLEGCGEDVVRLGPTNFVENMKESNWLVMLYLPGCPSCEYFVPIFCNYKAKGGLKYKKAVVNW